MAMDQFQTIEERWQLCLYLNRFLNRHLFVKNLIRKWFNHKPFLVIKASIKRSYKFNNNIKQNRQTPYNLKLLLQMHRLYRYKPKSAWLKTDWTCKIARKTLIWSKRSHRLWPKIMKWGLNCRNLTVLKVNWTAKSRKQPIKGISTNRVQWATSLTRTWEAAPRSSKPRSPSSSKSWRPHPRPRKNLPRGLLWMISDRLFVMLL